MTRSSSGQDIFLELIGFRFDPEIAEPLIYTITVSDERPILRDGYPIFFGTPQLGNQALAMSNCGASAFGPAPLEVSYVHDVTEVLYTLNEEDAAQSATLLDFINLILDISNATAFGLPDQYRSDLERFADHLTFHLEFGAFLKEQGLSRKALTDAIYWCVGMVACQMTIIR